MTSAVTAENGERFRGRNRIESRAMRAVVSAVTACELDADAKDVGVELADHDGALAVTVNAPVGITSLTAVAVGGSARTSSATVVERAGIAQGAIRSRVQDLTGSSIGIVNLRLTSARVVGDERVR